MTMFWPNYVVAVQKVLECVPGKTSTERTASLVLSNKLTKLNYGFEYGALAVKDHLDKVFFSDVVTSVMILLVHLTLSIFSFYVNTVDHETCKMKSNFLMFVWWTLVMLQGILKKLKDQSSVHGFHTFT